MNGSIPEMVVQRRRELERQRDALLAELAPIQAELRKYASAERALTDRPIVTRRRGPSQVRQRPTPESIQGHCLRAIEANPGMRTREIIDWISIHHATDFARTSLAPQLTRLCKDNWAESRNGRYYALPEAEDAAGR